VPVDDASTAALSRPARAQRLLAFSTAGTHRFELPRDGTLLIGRGRDAPIRLEDASISRQHAALHLDAPLSIEDLGSANGTRLDGRPLVPNRREPLALGSIIEVGAFRLIARPATTPMPTGPDDAMARVKEIVRRVAPSDLPVIITGETGVGKEVLAERIHQESLRAQGPLLRINCAALPDNLLESELFGHERGAFTGAEQAKPGLLETANAGTVLLDEVGELSAATQAKMLRVLESREVMRIGGRRPTPIDVRFIVATHEDLGVLVVMGRFREDLLFRLNGITIRVPPLRDRPHELPSLVRDLLAGAAARARRGPLHLSDDATLLLQSYRWPGNVRELRQVLERAVLLCPSDTLSVEHIVFGSTGADPAKPESLPRPGPSPRSEPPAGAPERDRIERALESTGGNQTEAAKVLGISRRTLSSRLDEYGILRPRKSSRKPEP
jgi:transcriptional regulator with PAS, ATPase and Fis domain